MPRRVFTRIFHTLKQESYHDDHVRPPGIWWEKIGTAGLVDLLVGRGDIAAIEAGHGSSLDTHIDPSGHHE